MKKVLTRRFFGHLTVVAVTVTLVGYVVVTSGCLSPDDRSPARKADDGKRDRASQWNEYVSRFHYFKDHQAKVCYSIDEPYSNLYSHTVTRSYVPCTPEVEKMVENPAP